MTAYEGFAEAYDVFMQDAPYDHWLKFLEDNWSLQDMDVVDIGCGTGILTVPLAHLCRVCIGVDQSEAMLSMAQSRAAADRVQVIWMEQDVRELRLPRPVGLAVSTCDVVNYMPSKDDVMQMFANVRRALGDGGSFAFDAIGPRRVEAFRDGNWHQIGEQAVLLHETDVSGTRIYHDVHLFLRDDASAYYRRIEEQHVQWFYDAEELMECLKVAGFEGVIQIHDFNADNSIKEPDRYVFWATTR